MRPLFFVCLAGACTEYSLAVPPPVPPAEPPGKDVDDLGDPPDWANCFEGFHGEYSNLSVDNPYVEPRRNEPLAPTDPAELDWWSEPSFQQFDASLDMGEAWYPVDEGLEGDPAYFAVRWRAWIRAWSNTTLTVSLGSADDAWIYINDEAVVESPGLQPFQPTTHEVSLSGGQYPMEVYYAHRAAESGFRMRVIGGDVTICYPEWDAEE